MHLEFKLAEVLGITVARMTTSVWLMVTRQLICTTYARTGDSAADHDIVNEDMVLIWAFGQVSPDYNHRSLTDEEFTTAQNEVFFPVDELKYHGGLNRAATMINFFEGIIIVHYLKSMLH